MWHICPSTICVLGYYYYALYYLLFFFRVSIATVYWSMYICLGNFLLIYLLLAAIIGKHLLFYAVLPRYERSLLLLPIGRCLNSVLCFQIISLYSVQAITYWNPRKEDKLKNHIMEHNFDHKS